MSANYSKARKNPSKRNEFFIHKLITLDLEKKIKKSCENANFSR